MTMLYHVSEQRDIRRFDPRQNPAVAEAVVWAIDQDHLRNYLLPRDCPRVTFYARPDSSAADVQRLLGTSRAVVAFEAAWLERVRAASLACYRLPAETFELHDASAGYYVSREPVVPAGVEIIDDCLAALANRGVEVRVLPSLWELRDAVVASTMEFSIIRMRNAQPRPEAGVAS